MNVYDFDDTIYKGDSTLDFYLFCLKKQPSLIRFLPNQVYGYLAYHLKLITKERFKEYFFSFLNGVNQPMKVLTQSFWENNEHKIYSYYLDQKDKNDVIISASPSFLLEPIGDKLGVSLVIATHVNPKNGKFAGKNCFGEEKVIRFRQYFPSESPESFFSDSLVDTPMASISSKAFIIHKGIISNWVSENSN